jgi:hypothetical protein
MADQYESNPDFHLSFGSEEAARFAANALRNHMRRLPREIFLVNALFGTTAPH